jgi:hypothetical protein
MSIIFISYNIVVWMTKYTAINFSITNYKEYDW